MFSYKIVSAAAPNIGSIGSPNIGSTYVLKNQLYLFYLKEHLCTVNTFTEHDPVTAALADISIKLIEVNSKHLSVLFDGVSIACCNQGIIKPGPDICRTLFSRNDPSFNLIPVLLTALHLFLPSVLYWFYFHLWCLFSNLLYYAYFSVQIQT